MAANIILIWYDTNAIKKDVNNEFNDHLSIFYDDQQSCVDYITSKSITETIFLISSLSCAFGILPIVNKFRQVDSVFIYSIEQEHKIHENLFDEYSKIIGIFDGLNTLFQSIQENIDLSIKQTQLFKFYEENQKSTRDLSKEAGSFLWLQLFKDVILKLPHDEQAKQEMIDKLKQIHRNNNKQLKLIEKFNRDYKSEDAIRWYTGEPFLYKQLNRALRTEDIELLYKFRYFISDLSKALFTEYELLKDSLDSTLKVYRGVKLSKEEATNLLKEDTAKPGEKDVTFISTNGYLSTSFDKEVAVVFAGEATDKEEPVLFEIEYNLAVTNSIIMASIAHYSKHQGEGEFLFDLDAAFKILSTSKDVSSNILVVKMEATDECSALAKEYFKEHRRHINTTSVVLVYGRLLIEIGQYDKCQEYFERLLENPNGEDLSFIYYYLGVTQYNKGNYGKALEYYQNSYDMLINAVPPREGASAFVLNDIGSIFSIRGHYDEALQYHMRALGISEAYSNRPGIATSLGSIGVIYRAKGEYDRALEYQIRCLRMKEQYLPREHKEIAKTLNHIAALFSDKDDLANAEKYYKESSIINEKCLPLKHDSIGSSLNHTATLLANQGKYDKALDFALRSFKNKENIFPNGHLTITKTLNRIGSIYYLKKDYKLAFDYLEKSLKMRENFFPDISDVSLITTLTYLGLVLINQQKYTDALVYSMRALNLAQTLLPIGHDDLTDYLTNTGILYREMKNYDKALEYFEKALNNEEQNPLNPNLIRLARNYDNMGICFCYHGDDDTGLEYRMKAVRIIDKVFPRIQYAQWIDTVGTVFCEKGLFDNALECYFISLNMKLECLPADHVDADYVDIAESFMRLGDIYIEKENHQNGLSNEQYTIQARFYFEKALTIYQKLDHSNRIYILNCIGTMYENIHKYRLALEYYRQASDIAEKCRSSDNSVKETNENNIARVKWFIK